VVRVAPLLLALVGSDLPIRQRGLVAVLGPRGTTTIVLGLLAFNGLPVGPVADSLLSITIVCVIGSVLFHGLGSDPLIHRAARRPQASTEPSTVDAKHSPAPAPGEDSAGAEADGRDITSAPTRPT
jgi:NhaP-type Na+/H+ or K+/H+ antiporter